MIVYLDTSALIPLTITEPSTARCARLWDEASAKFSSRITYVEASAALASALRAHRIDAGEHEAARAVLDALWKEISVVEVDETLMHAAAILAHSDALRGYDAVHCASALRIAALDVVALSGDRALSEAWRRHGLLVGDTNV
jgi:predicted nucleic acid-binding protein